MSNLLFPTDTTGVTPASGDIILIADVSDSNNPKDCTLAELPISTATQTALDAKQDTLTGLTASVAELNYTDGVTSAIQTQIDSKAPIASPTFTGTVSGITAAMVGAPSGSGSSSGTNTGDQTITLTGAVTGTGTGSFATTIATPGTVTVSSTNSTATAHTHAVTSSSAPGAAASLLATDASGHIGSTGTRIVKLWATDITATNAISGSITGNAATVTTNANLTGAVTSTGNATLLGSFTTSQLNTALSDNDIATGGGTATGTNTGNQTIANTSAATSHTVTLSATGGSVQLVEGSGITLTTTGTSADGIVTIASTGGGSGDVVGPASATDNAIARYDTTTGKLIQNSGVIINDSNAVSGISTLGVQLINASSQINVNYDAVDSIVSTGGLTFAGGTYCRINDGSSNELIKFPTTPVTSAVNEFTITNSATGTGPTISSTGGDTNIDFNIVTKGTGILKVNGSAVATGNVTKVGTPVNNQIGVWTGDGTLEGDTALTFDTTTDTLTSGIFNGTALTASQLTATDASKNIVSLAVATYPSLTEISYVKGVTSAIQTQINTKAPSASPTFTGTVVFPSGQALIAPVLGTPTSGTLTNCTGLPLAGVVDSTTEALGVGSLEVGHASDTTLTRVSAGVIAVEGSTVPTLSVANTWTATQTEKAVLYTNDAITASGNAATIPVTHRLHTVTNNSAATLTITLTTAGATDGQMHLIRILDFSAATQTITWVNTENSTVSAPTTSNGSTTLFLTVGFIYNGATSKWRCISYA